MNSNADRLLNNLEEYPHAFVLACIMDKQMKAELAWLIPYRIEQKLGDFHFSTLEKLTQHDIAQLMNMFCSANYYKLENLKWLTLNSK